MMTEKHLKGSSNSFYYSYKTGEFIRFESGDDSCIIQITEDAEDFLNQDDDIKNVDVFVSVDKDTIFNIMDGEIQNVVKQHLDKSEASLKVSKIIDKYSTMMDMID